MPKQRLELVKLNTGYDNGLFLQRPELPGLFCKNVDNTSEVLQGIKTNVNWYRPFNITSGAFIIDNAGNERFFGWDTANNKLVSTTNIEGGVWQDHLKYRDQNMNEQDFPALSDVKLYAWNRNTIIMTANNAGSTFSIIITYITKKLPHDSSPTEELFIGDSRMYTGFFDGIEKPYIYISGNSGCKVVQAGQEGDKYNFTKGEIYRYGITYVYDGYASSKIVPMVDENGVGAIKKIEPVSSTAETVERLEVTIALRVQGGSPSWVMNHRITGVKLFRQKLTQTGTTTKIISITMNGNQFNIPVPVPIYNEEGEWTLVEEINFKDTTWISDGGIYKYTVKDIGKGIGVFQDTEGFSPYIDPNLPTFRGMLKVGNTNVVWNVNIPDIKESNGFILFSVPGKPLSFNYPYRFLLINEPIVNIVEYQGVLYAFCKYNLYVINPQNLSSYKVTGVFINSENHVTVTSLGIFWLNETGVYYFSGRKQLVDANDIQIISRDIWEMPSVSFPNLKNAVVDAIEYEFYLYIMEVPKQNGVGVFWYTLSGELFTAYLYLFDYFKNRWYYFVLGIDNDGSNFYIMNKSKDTYVFTNGVITKLFSGNTRTGFLYYFKLLPPFDKKRKINYIKVKSEGTIELRYSLVNSGVYITPATTITSEMVNLYGRYLSLLINGNLNSKVYSLEVIYRDMLEDK